MCWSVAMDQGRLVASGLPSVTWAESVEAVAAASAVPVAVLAVLAVPVERKGLQKKLNRVSVELIP